jgi:peroxiredoxin
LQGRAGANVEGPAVNLIKKAGWFQLITYLAILLLAAEVILLAIQNRDLKKALSSMSVVSQVEPLKAGDRVEAFKLQTMDGNVNELNYADPAKKYLLFILSTTCPHCEKTLPVWSDIVAKNSNDNCSIIGVSIHPIDQTIKFAADKKITFYLASAAKDTSFYRKYRIPGVPETILLDGSGIVQRTWVGELNPEQAEEIENLTAANKTLTN